MKRGSTLSGAGIPGPESQGDFPEGRQRGSGTSCAPPPPPAAASAQAVGLLLLGLAACPASQGDAGSSSPTASPSPGRPGHLSRSRGPGSAARGFGSVAPGRRGLAGRAGSGRDQPGPQRGRCPSSPVV